MRLAERGEMRRYLQHPLAHDKVRYVGEPVAAVLADDRYRAEDALGAVQVRYAPLPALVDARAASGPDAPLLFDAAGSNVAASYTVECGDVDAALREADLVLRERFDVQRHAGVPIETRGALAEWDAGRGVLSMWGMTKVPHINRRIIAEHVGLPEHRVHFLQTDVGGAFGIRGEVYPRTSLWRCWPCARAGRCAGSRTGASTCRPPTTRASSTTRSCSACGATGPSWAFTIGSGSTWAPTSAPTVPPRPTTPPPTSPGRIACPHCRARSRAW
jgi:CO/xanthine dehydrogenase Mo-binding subunit